MKLDGKNPMNVALMSVVIFEAIVIWLGFPGMLQVSQASLGPAIFWASLVTVLCIAAAVGLRRGWGFPVGWVAQVGVIGLGLLTPWMFAVGIIFGVIWTTSFVLGKRIEKIRRETS